MFLRLLLTGSSLALGYNAVLMSGCASVTVVWPPEDGVWACLEAGSAGVLSGFWASAVVWTIVAFIMVLAWLPVFMRWRGTRRAQTDVSLVENLHRVAESPVDQTEPAEFESPDNSAVSEAVSSALEQANGTDARPAGQPHPPTKPSPAAAVNPIGDSPDHLSSIGGLHRRVELIEQELSSDSLSPRQATAQWIELLREANKLHNNGELPTGIFQQVNTRLLDMFALSESEPVDTHAR